ncbi:MBL fold metallo-hydrolase [Mucilaginibacter myungsuensis]|uniref:MBL fold metallo-hydrolase n=1 Tax=Mucilaginibacter myungsuensis TaxID=649104 RepID=A0A929KX84_9SPHI|nr:MBL fold metallo-hydrolase [Mucilaginibacter myungsuensis]MBE9662128.1 MBL fold metallo-hydrolase [Mucilaginibacter myungsuensis]MDN3599438.1 MBL fold metallo-hydrolase [Mucilaginibacter myungsuensis]
MGIKPRHLATLILLLLTVIVYDSCNAIRSTGRIPAGEHLKGIAALANYDSLYGFRNLDTAGQQKPRKINPLRILTWSLRSKPAYVTPDHELPWVKADLNALPADTPTVVWFGHSSFLLKTKQGNILADPQFSGFTGPFSWMIKPYHGSDEYKTKDMPVIDVLIISHDHYDHLDMGTVVKLKDKVKRVVVPKGVGSHFIHWGYDPKIITELNWDESASTTSGIKITATPARHRSGRVFKGNRTLWASYVIDAGGRKVFFSGDTGYGTHFKKIGDKYGPMDLAMIECGQYNDNWKTTHMHPSQSVQAVIDLKAKTAIPVHWAKFAEAYHPWDEPVRLFLKSADSLKQAVSVPMLGEPYVIGSKPKLDPWWDESWH